MLGKGRTARSEERALAGRGGEAATASLVGAALRRAYAPGAMSCTLG